MKIQLSTCALALAALLAGTAVAGDGLTVIQGGLTTIN